MKKKPIDEAGTKAKDESKDHIYFTVTPRLVWALSEDPFDLALWEVVKDIAGENGACILAREDLAALAMMSEGQVSVSRDRLLERGLLEGELKRDPGYPQEVWHLSIPDIWEANVRWARMYPTIKSRVEFKRSQKRAKKAERELKKKLKDPSLHDGLKDPSHSDERISHSDERISPSDVKKNVLEKPKEEIKEEELRELFLEAAPLVFPGSKQLATLREVEAEIQGASFSLEPQDRVFSVSGLGPDRSAYYESRYRRSFERQFVGLLGAEVSIDFSGNGDELK